MDKSNGYEGIASIFIEVRGRNVEGIGTSSVRRWVRTLPLQATVLDLGCGTGFPISKAMVDEGRSVYGIDASPTLVNAYQQHFPKAPVACEAVEDSLFFNRTFDGVVAWGLLFLLPEEGQVNVIRKASSALPAGGKLLFTAPAQETKWKDVLTGQTSTSLGTKRYKEILAAFGVSLLEEFEDEGHNHYYSALKR